LVVNLHKFIGSEELKFRVWRNLLPTEIAMCC